MSQFSITSTVKHYSSNPYHDIKNAVLGKRYSLSLVFVGPTRAQNLNQTYRSKSYIPNVLSFPLNDSTGEIYICPQVANKEAPNYNLTVDDYTAFLFIHGLLHLKGHDHGDKMERYELKFMKQFNIRYLR